MNPVTVVSVGDTPTGIIEALAQQPGEMRVVRRCPELADLLAACQSGLAQVAVIAEFAGDLTATLVDRLAAVGVSVVAVAETLEEARRLRGIGATAVTAGITAEEMGAVVRATVENRRHPGSAGFAVPATEGRLGPPVPPWEAAPALTAEAGTFAPGPESSVPAGSEGLEDTFIAGAPGTHDTAAEVDLASGHTAGHAAGRKGTGTTGDETQTHEAHTDEPDSASDRGADVLNNGADVLNNGADVLNNNVASSGQPRQNTLHRPGPGEPETRTPRLLDKFADKPQGLRARITNSLQRGRKIAHPSASLESSLEGMNVKRQKNPLSSKPQLLTEPYARQGTLVAVWGPIGSPGRTTLAINLAAEQAAAGRTVLLIDADSYGASIAATLGLLDESASFAQACRAADQGGLSRVYLAKTASQVIFAGGTFSLLTGLTRADRWPELRAAAVERVLGLARELAELVVVDCGFGLENDEELSYDTVAPRRNAATLMVLAQADIVYAVGNSDPIGIPRLIRGLGELQQGYPVTDVRVVVNKVRRKAVGRSPEKSLAQAWERFGPAQGISHFLPWDPELTDKALMEGKLLLEVAADAPLRRAIRDIDCAAVQRNSNTAVTNATA